MQRFFAHVIVSMLLVSLMTSGCYSYRNLSVLADRDAVTIGQARYDVLWATPHEQLSAAEVAERDSLWRTQFQWDSTRAATETEFDRLLLIRRDSIILDQARYEVLLSTPELGQAEATELEILQLEQVQRDSTLADVESDLRDRHLSTAGAIGISFLTLAVILLVIATVGLAIDPIGG